MKRRNAPPNYFQRDLSHRKKILEIYNQTREDFGTLKEYNDYLEEIETIINNLTYEIEVQSQLAKIERYRKEHQNRIYARQSQQAGAAEALTTGNAPSALASIYERLPQPKSPQEAERFTRVVQQGYRGPGVDDRPVTPEEVAAGGVGDCFERRQRQQAAEYFETPAALV